MQHRLLPPSSDPHNAACHSIPLLLPTVVVVVLLMLGLVLLLIALSKTSPPHDMLPEQVAVQHLQSGKIRQNLDNLHFKRGHPHNTKTFLELS